MPFSYEPLTLEGLILVKPKVYADERGYFMELFKSSGMQFGGITGEFVQDNLSYSRKGTVRGLHYQMKPKMQGKLVACLRGAIFDVAVDIKVGLPTLMSTATSYMAPLKQATSFPCILGFIW